METEKRKPGRPKSPPTDGPTKTQLARRREAAKQRKTTLEGGGRRLELLLSAPASEALAAAMARRKESASKFITRLLMNDAGRSKPRKKVEVPD